MSVMDDSSGSEAWSVCTSVCAAAWTPASNCLLVWMAAGVARALHVRASDGLELDKARHADDAELGKLAVIELEWIRDAGKVANDWKEREVWLTWCSQI